MRSVIGFGVAIVGAALLFSILDVTQAQGSLSRDDVLEAQADSLDGRVFKGFSR